MKSSHLLPSLIVLLCSQAFPARAAEESPRIDHIYADESAAATPDFRRDIVPLLGKVGCNGRACHGSFQGQGGFRLSLFGYDFKADHENLSQGEKPRVNTEAVAESLILKKALEQVDHEGGKRFDEGSWQHRVLKRWIESGAKPVAEDSAEFVKLEITPSEIVASNKDETFQLKAVAVWSDGSRQDVTPLCRFRSNNDQVATIDESGLVRSKEPGDSHVVVFYDNGVVPVPIIQPVSRQVGDKYPAVATNTKIDELVVEKLKKLGVVPSEQCSDADFLRRVSLDMTGTLPLPQEVEAFLADGSPSKRQAKIDELLERPAYAAWWATRFSDWTGNNTGKMNYQTSGVDAATRSTEWYEWLRRRIASNMPYDQICEGMILAVSRQEGEDYAEYSERMSGYYRKEPQGDPADLPTMPHFWARKNFNQPDDRALGFAYSFLGLRIQCAQCHKHPFDSWTKNDFDRFKDFFARPRYATPPANKDERLEMLTAAGLDPKELKGGQLGKAVKEHMAKGETMPFDELFILPGKKAVKPKKGQPQQRIAGRTAKILGGDEVTIGDMADPRQALMDWLRDESNPYFAKAIVNRIWSGYFNVGIVDPVDDLSLANPASNEPLLDYLEREFIAHHYDLKWLHRTIANSDTYQRSWKTNETNAHDERNFSHAVPRRLPAEVAYDALQLATMSDPAADKWKETVKGRAIANPIVGQRRKNDYALTIFGRSVRETNCECDRSSEASLLQTVFTQNDAEVLSMIDGKGRWVDQMLKSAQAEEDKSEKNGKLSQLSTKQLRRRLQAAEDKGRTKVANSLAAELKRREAESQAEDAKDQTMSNPSVEALVKAAYLRTLSRYPEPSESKRAAAYFEETEDQARAVKDLLWALVNTKEFVINH